MMDIEISSFTQNALNTFQKSHREKVNKVDHSPQSISLGPNKVKN